MEDELRLGSVPTEEGYQQAGTANYHVRAQNETKIYKKQLLRLFPIPTSLKGKVGFQVKVFTGEKCLFYEVVIKYNGGLQDATQFAENVKANCPTEWDEQSIDELRAMHLIPD
ncbi:hypothetical protein [Nostoc sp. DedQUE07]|uniref:hypothetical protein n=1 Tax=Nostoc sp. DedQUE07 TaxID=3075392 RepID=UPI002AD5A78A|nr:hypothetical protein [Nostoc sp. DedQUE07]MDZ8131945.1 hypothetical protein [Nostoc sp. DedQUE07]